VTGFFCCECFGFKPLLASLCLPLKILDSLFLPQTLNFHSVETPLFPPWLLALPLLLLSNFYSSFELVLWRFLKHSVIASHHVCLLHPLPSFESFFSAFFPSAFRQPPPSQFVSSQPPLGTVKYVIFIPGVSF